MSSISIHNIWFSFRSGQAVLRGVTLDIKPGEIVAMIGRNGAGKTTTFRIAAGLLRPDDGSVSIAGVPLAGDRNAFRRVTAFIPDHSLLYDMLSAEENMNMFGMLWGIEPHIIRERTDRLLAEVGLAESRNQIVSQFSSGMKQKLSFCCALLHQPSAIIIDEPFTAMDKEAAGWSEHMLKQRARDGSAVLFSSHDGALVERIATRTVRIEDGRIVVP